MDDHMDVKPIYKRPLDLGLASGSGADPLSAGPVTVSVAVSGTPSRQAICTVTGPTPS